MEETERGVSEGKGKQRKRTEDTQEIMYEEVEEIKSRKMRANEQIKYRGRRIMEKIKEL